MIRQMALILQIKVTHFILYLHIPRVQIHGRFGNNVLSPLKIFFLNDLSCMRFGASSNPVYVHVKWPHV